MSRVAQHDIDPIFVARWSPRAMSGRPATPEELARLFEAARWAPSSGNSQPWRFLYARAGTPAFDKLFALLVEGNRAWCVRAGALVVVMSRSTSETGRPLPTHSFDAGAAWMSLALQGSRMGLVVHGMAGFDYDRARTELAVPEGMSVECMVAIGHPGDVADLPERQRAREQPSDRKAIETFAFEGALPPGA